MQKTIWITGLSGSGKSTISEELCKVLRERGETVVLLDGDQLREVFCAEANSKKNHGREGRLKLAMQYTNLCNILARQNLTVVIATISMFKEVHDWNRENLPNYFEVFLSVPFEILRNRDPKGIYYRYEKGELNNVAGLDLEVDEPKNPDLLFDYNNGSFSVKEIVIAIISKVYK